MQTTTRVLAFVLAGGEGKRLAPLTQHLAKPAVPFHTRHRLIDFTLSNLRNSGIQAIHVLMQYQPQSVLEHLMEAWPGPRRSEDCFLDPVVGGIGDAPYAGTADAVYRNRERILAFRPDVVAIFGADHIYRMDVRQMIDHHLACDADATIAALPVPVAEARGFGVIETAQDGRIRGFAEKPAMPATMPGRPEYALASMGIYLFSTDVLLDALAATHAAAGTDFGGDLLPAMVTSHRLMAYDFEKNTVSGAAPDSDPPYWRDVGTIDAYFAAHMDTLGPSPRFRVTNPAWPMGGAIGRLGANGTEWSGGALRGLPVMSPLCDVDRTILRRDVHIGERATLSRCVVGDRVTIGARCRLRNAVVARDNHLPEGFEAGFDPELDRQRWPVSDTGILVIPRGSFPATSSRLARYKISDPIPRIGLTVRPESNRAGRSECPQYTSHSA